MTQTLPPNPLDPHHPEAREACYDVQDAIRQGARLSLEDYRRGYHESINDPDRFWAREARKWLHWDQEFTTVVRSDFARGEIAWFEEGKLNASVNCLDRHLPERAEQTALIFEGDTPGVTRTLSYGALHEAVCRLANLLKALGVKPLDRVCLYLPMIPEGVIAMLACARIGATHSVVFGGFSAEALKDRLLDADARLIITADGGWRGGRFVPLKQQVDEAVRDCPAVDRVVVVRHTGTEIAFQPGRDLWYHEGVSTQPSNCPPFSAPAEHPLFILYTSGSTGRPKGVVHSTGGYLLQAALTHALVFDYREGEVYWCTADFGWITGHTYVVYGPLLNGATVLLFEGVPTYPDPGRFWSIIDQHRVNLLYTAPTAIRALMGEGNQWVHAARRDSLRVLGSVGEPINPEAWAWYYHVVGDSRCPIVDTWWQTETGGIMITPLVGATPLKPGSAAWPFFGVEPVLMDGEGHPVDGVGEGVLTLARSWPGQARTLYQDAPRFFETYLAPYPHHYFTGDGARRDADGYYWITGRVDDVINMAGHRLGTAEIESALVQHPAVMEAAVVGYPHPIKGQGVYAYVTLVQGALPSDPLRQELIEQVRHAIGPIATPQIIQFTAGLPKTRSGKIMRRILRKIAAGEFDALGDRSTLADPGCLEILIEENRALTLKGGS